MDNYFMAQPQTHYYWSNYCLILLNFEVKKRKKYFQVDPFIRNASIKLTLQYSLPRQPPVKIELLKIGSRLQRATTPEEQMFLR